MDDFVLDYGKDRSLVATIYRSFGIIVTLVAAICRSIRTITKLFCIGLSPKELILLGMVATKVTLVKIFCDGGL